MDCMVCFDKQCLISASNTKVLGKQMFSDAGKAKSILSPKRRYGLYVYGIVWKTLSDLSVIHNSPWKPDGKTLSDLSVIRKRSLETGEAFNGARESPKCNSIA